MNIGLDADETCLDFMSPLIDFLRKRGHSIPDYAEHHTFQLDEVWECSIEERDRRISSFYHSPEFEAIQPLTGALEGFSRLFPPHAASIVTSRPSYMIERTRSSFNTHFSGKLVGIHHTQQYELGVNAKVTKGTISKRLGIDLFVEDHLFHAEEIASHGIPVLLLPRPWNLGKPTPFGVTRVSDWDAIVRVVESYK